MPLTDRPPHRDLALIGLLTFAVLVLTAGTQIYDTNFYTLWEATALLAGDHPYRDFYEWGVPLQMLLSAAVQRLVGYRLIGEFLIHWAFITAGAVLAFAIGLRLARSRRVLWTTTAVALIVLAATPTFHYPKLLFYPLAIWLAWRYLERPGTGRAAGLGLLTAVAFLFRHDHGVYIGLASVLACALACAAHPAVRVPRLLARDIAAYTVTAVVAIAPWALVVQTTEGLPEYVRMRGALYQEWSARASPYRTLLHVNPIDALTPEHLPDDDAAALRAGDVDTTLLLRAYLPDAERARVWLQQISLIVPFLVLLPAAAHAVRRWRRREPIPVAVCATVLAAAFLAFLESRLFREAGYFVVVAPLTAALAARVLAPPRSLAGALGVLFLAVTTVAAFGFARNSDVLEPWRQVEQVPIAFAQLTASPPVDAFLTRAAAAAYDEDDWAQERVDAIGVIMRYAYDCTTPDDRLLVTGSTPYQVGYYAERSIAGGHLFWHHLWRSDPSHEARSLALLQQQSVPLVISTSDPALDDFARYPRIHDYLRQHYVELPGTNGRVLVDRRRPVVGRFSRLGFPCFK